MKPLVNGPLNKSLFTQQLELVAKCLIHAPEKVKLSVQDQGDRQALHAKLGKVDIDLSNLFKKANFSHLQFNEKDSTAFMQEQTSNKANHYHWENHNYSNYPNYSYTDYSALTAAEKAAIKNYSMCHYSTINDMLHERIYTYYNSDDIGLKNTVMNLTLLASGLNKIMPETHLNNYSSYRGEKWTTQAEINERIKLANEGGGYTDEKAYMSTSSSYSTANCFKGKSLIVFDGIYGKNISGLSSFPSEKEFLLAPGKILWESHTTDRNNHIFHAKLIAPLVEGEDDFSNKDLSTFKELYHWAKNHGIQTDFLTSNVLDMVKTPAKAFTQQLRDFLSFEQDTIPGLDDNNNQTASNHASFAPIPALEMAFANTAMDNIAMVAPAAIEVM